jgi:hypothetical protein
MHIPYSEWLYYSAIAHALHCIIYWQFWESGDFIPLMQPVDERTWQAIVH